MKSELHEWETVYEVEDFPRELTSRMRVPGGWLYSYRIDPNNSEFSKQSAVAMTFVPDPKIYAKRGKKPRTRPWVRSTDCIARTNNHYP